MPFSVIERAQHREHIQELMALRGLTDVVEIRRALAEVHGVQISNKTVSRHLAAIRDSNWSWLSGLARTAYIAGLRKRHDFIWDGMVIMHQAMTDDNTKPHAKAMCANSLVQLNQEITSMAENQGLYRHWDEIMNAPPAKKEEEELTPIAKTQSTQD